MVLVMADDNRISREIWDEKVSRLYYAYQPIVNIHTGATLGFEALLRGWEDAGFKSIGDVFNRAYQETVLYSLDLHLRSLAVDRFYGNPGLSGLKLFYNLDNRVLEMPDYLPGNTQKLLKSSRLYTSNICFEISEKHEFASYQTTNDVLREYKSQNFRIAIDDFGAGYSGLTLLYHSEPDYIKIDRFFIENINDDSRKKFFVSNVVNLAHMMGIVVIAEGIETVEEYFICREIGCDYAQGFLIQKPETDHGNLKLRYPFIEELTKRQNRFIKGDMEQIIKEMSSIVPVTLETSTSEILDRFRNDYRIQNLPVINRAGEPQGILREFDLKKYVYSKYGISILHHKYSSEGLESLVFRPPIMEVSNSIENILELYSLNADIESVIITENGKYRGILDSSAILRILSEKQISIAQDQNPLTKLPGNQSINQYLSSIIQNKEEGKICVYFDFDNFKPFNDTYGFRQGDRIIRLFSDILKELSGVRKEFIGHLGGDDFFVGYGMGEYPAKEILEDAKSIIERFRQDVIPFYNEQEKQNGYLIARNRNGRTVKFPLLSVSAAVLCLKGIPENCTTESISERIAGLKKKAKKASSNIAFSSMESREISEKEFCS